MARYVLSKDNDKIILTDTKTGKKRVLTVEDIDYVVDDNQKLRDENTIATYFRLKEEDFKPKTVTKKANLVQEYKEAKKYDKSDINQTDPMLDFINKFNLTSLERTSLAQMPYKETIRKFDRPEGEKNVMLNDFQRVTEKIIEKGIKNIEEYIKNYLTKYNNDHPVLFEDIFLVKSNYKNTADYEKIKKYIDDGNHINNLEDLYKQGINVFKGIQLGCLNQLFNNYQQAKNLMNEPWLEKYKIGMKIQKNNNNWYMIYNFNNTEVLSDIYFIITVFITIFDVKLIGTKETLLSIYEQGLKFFNNINSINQLSIYAQSIENKIGLDAYDYNYQLGIWFENKYTAITPVNGFTQNEIQTKYMKIKKYAEACNIQPNDTQFNQIFSSFKELVMKVLKPWPSLIAGGKKIINPDDLINDESSGTSENFAGGWTDKTLTRIDVIIDTLKGMGIGMGWSDRTLTRIDDILSQLNGMGLCSGWTDKTLTRIDDILSQLNGMGNEIAGGWTDKSLTRIDNILSQLNGMK